MKVLSLDLSGAFKIVAPGLCVALTLGKFDSDRSGGLESVVKKSVMISTGKCRMIRFPGASNWEV
jgi:hypothetical protein